jgi:hypothetical protein
VLQTDPNIHSKEPVFKGDDGVEVHLLNGRYVVYQLRNPLNDVDKSLLVNAFFSSYAL